MKPLIALMAAVAISLASFPAAFAETRVRNDCPPGQQSCSDTSARGPVTKPGKAGHEKGGQEKVGQDRNKPGKAAQKSGKSAHAGPKKGESGRGGQPFQRASNSRFQPPPHGQEYRVVNEHLVLVDSQSLKIVAVLGVLSSLLN